MRRFESRAYHKAHFVRMGNVDAQRLYMLMDILVISIRESGGVLYRTITTLRYAVYYFTCILFSQ